MAASTSTPSTTFCLSSKNSTKFQKFLLTKTVVSFPKPKLTAATSHFRLISRWASSNSNFKNLSRVFCSTLPTVSTTTTHYEVLFFDQANSLTLVLFKFVAAPKGKSEINYKMMLFFSVDFLFLFLLQVCEANYWWSTCSSCWWMITSLLVIMRKLLHFETIMKIQIIWMQLMGINYNEWNEVPYPFPFPHVE